MLKIWIVHHQPERRAALARLVGLGNEEAAIGAPLVADFADVESPRAIVLGVAGDFERELEFVHQVGPRVTGARWILLVERADQAEAARLFDGVDVRILDAQPPARQLREAIAEVLSVRRVPSLSARRARQSVSQRFSSWLGGIDVPGLLTALDPARAPLPLLVRGAPGSGRALVAQYAELHRVEEGATPIVRIPCDEIEDLPALIARLAATRSGASTPTPAIFLDEIDALPAGIQNTLAEWIQHDSAPAGLAGAGVRWIATALPGGWQDPIEPALVRAFSPLQVDVPALAKHPEALAAFASEIARAWARSVGGPERHFSETALAQLAEHAWHADRSEIEAVLRASLAAGPADPIEPADLRFPGEPEAAVLLAREHDATERALPSVEAFDESSLLSEAAFDLRGQPGSDPEISVDLDPFAENGLAASDSSADPWPAAAEIETPDLASPMDALTAPDAAANEPPPDHSESPSPLASPTAHEGWRRLARSLAHEIGNPLVSIRTFAELLPEHYEDATFRERFAELVGRDVAHIDDVIGRLHHVAEHEKTQFEPVDVSSMLEELLEERRERIRQRRLVVLRELERDEPLAWADPLSLRVALAGLLDRALDGLPERGDLFVATRFVERRATGEAHLRILLRHHNPDLGGRGEHDLAELNPTANILEYVLAETVIESSGGRLTLDASDSQETLILVELQTPARGVGGLSQ